MIHVLFNPSAGNDTGTATSRKLEQFCSGEELKFYSVKEIEDKAAFINALPKEDKVIISGGDGTLHFFVNETYGKLGDREILYFASGSGNDFLTDIGFKPEQGPVKITQYLKHLPKVEVNGVTKRFLNNVGFGIDGYCCEEGDRQRANKTTDKPINYTAIAIKGLLGAFKPLNATITADGVTESYKKVWLAPSMNGRYYGGGMMAAPDQNRLNPEHTVSLMLFYGKGKLVTLSIFPSIFKGEHVKHTECVKVKKAKDVVVKFDRPCALQIDGETYLGVTEYHVMAGDQE